MSTKKSKTLLLLLLCVSSMLHAQLNTAKVLDALKSRRSDLAVVCAHRGYWRENGVPENSLLAVQRAADMGLEMVEVDIKMSSDGEPVLMHDWNLGRTTELGMGRNYLVNNWTNGSLQSLRLKDKNGNLTNQHLPTFRQLLSYIRDHKIAMVISLDIKTADAAKACWQIMNEGNGWRNAWNNPAYNWVIFKMNADIFPWPSDLENALNWIAPVYALKYVPVYTTNMIDKIDCYKQLFAKDRYKGKTYLLTAEIDIKERNGIQQDMMNQAWSNNMTIGCFNAIPDAGGSNFYNNDGSCCYTLKDKLFYSKNDPNRYDKVDNRGNWQFLIDIGIRWIVTDEPVNLINDYLKGKGLRNTSYYYNNARTAEPTTAENTDTLLNTPQIRVDPFTEGKALNTGIKTVAFPNPTDGALFVKFNHDTTGVVKFRFTNLTGTPVFTQQEMLGVGVQQVALPNPKSKGMAPGIYLLEIIPAGKQNRDVIKIMVQ